MPRQARAKSQSGIYHIMLRGINQQQIFEDEEAKRIIARVSKSTNTSDFQGIDPKRRDKLLRKLKDRGLSIRQISRLTGISKGIDKTGDGSVS